MIPVTAWTPDQSPYGSTNASEALNVLPAAQTYRPLRSLLASGSSMSSSRVFGGVSFRGTDLSVHNYGGDASKLYSFDGSAWTDFTRGSGGYTVPPQGMWRFAQFNDDCIAVDGTDEIQVIAMSAGTSFDDLAGASSFTGARYVARCRDVVVIGRWASNPQGVGWSDIESDTIWGAGSADTRTMDDGGQIMGVFGGESIIVLQERCIRLGIRTDYPLTFTFDKVSQDKGCLCEWASAQHENLLFFIGQDGFYQLTSGQELKAIGLEKVDRFFFADCDLNNLHRVVGAVDPVNKLWVISYPSVSGMGEPDSLMIYSWPLDRWAHARVACDMILPAMVQSSWHGDNVDSLLGFADDTDVLVDDPLFTGAGRLLLGAFTSDHELGFFNGDNLEATVDTGEAQLSQGQRSLVTGATPIVDGAAAPSVTLGTRDNLGSSVAWGSPQGADEDGFCEFLKDARYHRFRITVAAGTDWNHIIGIEPEFKPSGER